ncbi:hypothetical protein L6164_030997 [Bauhinia variegata]|uniref:Uncharacterized protein n=1 Tax=Bauhinia variegata TaxID=167791 RepID=A0ACB9LE40_BAUVA|nr:hypothetical protein L6164_030997 [Bauhinia variegata]
MQLRPVTAARILVVTVFLIVSAAHGHNITRKVIHSHVTETPTPAPTQQNLMTTIMSKHGCKVFADTLLADDAEKTFEDNIGGGLTVFCPTDDAFKAFWRKYKNLSAEGKTALLEYHGVPVYQSLETLRSNNGLQNTLATDGANNYDLTVQNDGEQVTLKTKITTARITGTLLDEEPLAIFTIDKVLLPRELFKAKAPTPSPAPAPEPAAADAPETPKKKGAPPPHDSDSDAPADSPDDAANERAADDNSAVGFGGVGYVTAGLALVFGFLQL